MNARKNKPSYSFNNIKRDSTEKFLILGVFEYRRLIPRKTNMILGLSKWDTSIPWQSSFSFRSLWCGYIWTQSLVCSENRNNHTRLVMKYIFISILIIPFVSVTILFSLSTPVFGKTSQFESVDECVIKTFQEERDYTRLNGIKNLMEMMKNQNQTGNRMFDVVYSKCSKEVSNDRQVVNLPFTNTLPPKIWNINWRHLVFSSEKTGLSW